MLALFLVVSDLVGLVRSDLSHCDQKSQTLVLFSIDPSILAWDRFNVTNPVIGLILKAKGSCMMRMMNRSS